jgi:rare lipoprotein A
MKPLFPVVILQLFATIGLLGAGLVAPVQAEPVLRQTGTASIYADLLEGRETASGDTFRQDALTAASRSLPLGTRIRVTNPDTGRMVQLVVTDRGPYAGDRILDLSRAAADRLGIDLEDGLATVHIEAHAADQPTKALRRMLRDRAQATR